MLAEGSDSQINGRIGRGGRREVRVLLVDSRDVVRRGLRAVLEDADDLVVAAETGALAPGDGLVGAVAPDVAIVDVGDDLAAARESVRILRETNGGVPAVLLGHDDDATLRAASSLDAAAVIFDDAPAADVRDVVRRVARDEPAPRPAAHLASARMDAVDLTFREGQVLRLISEGLTNREIAVRLGLAEKTVKNYASAIFAKLHIEHRTQAVIYALTHAQRHEPDTLR